VGKKLQFRQVSGPRPAVFGQHEERRGVRGN
jgi:hypothetical protein